MYPRGKRGEKKRMIIAVCNGWGGEGLWMENHKELKGERGGEELCNANVQGEGEGET